MEEEYIEILDQLDEEGYFDSRSEGIRYALDRKIETLNPEYDPVTQEQEEINQRSRELGKEYEVGDNVIEEMGTKQF